MHISNMHFSVQSMINNNDECVVNTVLDENMNPILKFKVREKFDAKTGEKIREVQIIMSDCNFKSMLNLTGDNIIMDFGGCPVFGPEPDFALSENNTPPRS